MCGGKEKGSEEVVTKSIVYITLDSNISLKFLKSRSYTQWCLVSDAFMDFICLDSLCCPHPLLFLQGAAPQPLPPGRLPILWPSLTVPLLSVQAALSHGSYWCSTLGPVPPFMRCLVSMLFSSARESALVKLGKRSIAEGHAWSWLLLFCTL